MRPRHFRRGFRRVLPGGGTSELAVSYELERIREAQKGMEAFGMEAVSAALRKPMSQILLNAGYNPLEKMEEVRAAQIRADSDCMGIDCDSGRVVDYEELGVLDPAPVKLHGLRATGEVAATVFADSSRHQDERNRRIMLKV